MSRTYTKEWEMRALEAMAKIAEGMTLHVLGLRTIAAELYKLGIKSYKGTAISHTKAQEIKNKHFKQVRENTENLFEEIMHTRKGIIRKAIAAKDFRAANEALKELDQYCQQSRGGKDNPHRVVLQWPE